MQVLHSLPEIYLAFGFASREPRLSTSVATHLILPTFFVVATFILSFRRTLSRDAPGKQAGQPLLNRCTEVWSDAGKMFLTVD